MKKKLFTLEYSQERELLEVHLNSDSAKELINILDNLIKNNENEHYHLMTEDWGGSELTSDKQNLSTDFDLINHLKLFFWKDK